MRTIVLYSAVNWDGLFARPQHLALQFVAMGARVLFVEPAVSLLAPLKRRELLKNLGSSHTRVLEDRLAVVTPPPVIPAGYGWRPINKHNQNSIANVVRKSLAALGWVPTIVLTHLPGSADMPQDIPIVYDCVDDHAAFADLSSLWRKEVVLELERDLLRRSRCVFASSDALLRLCQASRPDTRLIGNGVSIEPFALAARTKTGATGLKGVVVGFYGGIGQWIDLELIRKAAHLRPDFNFMLIGPVEAGCDMSGFPPNVHMRGLTPYKELPALLADFDVALVPFKNTTLTQSVNPLKLYEYFAAGKPVLVGDIPELTRWGSLVYPVRTPERFVQAVEMALNEPESLREQRRQVAAENSWQAKAEEMLSCLEEQGL